MPNSLVMLRQLVWEPHFANRYQRCTLRLGSQGPTSSKAEGDKTDARKEHQDRNSWLVAPFPERYSVFSRATSVPLFLEPTTGEEKEKQNLRK